MADMHTPRPFPAARPHGEITEVLPELFFVTGTVGMPGPLPVRFSRNMTIVRQGERLVLINSVRLSDDGLAALDKLGQVTDVVRLAGNHGLDDPFYADRYRAAKVWVVKGQRYTAGFDTRSPKTYFTPGVEMDESTTLPIEGARLIAIQSSPPEGLFHLAAHGGVIVSGDCLQNWSEPDAYFNWLGRVMLKRFGFIKPANVGPGWLKQCKPPKAELRALLDVSYKHVLPAHGTPVLEGAPDRYRAALERAAA
jgi:hypothetical protein